MKRNILFLILSALLAISCSELPSVKSPNGKISVYVNDTAMIVSYCDRPIQIINHELGMWTRCMMPDDTFKDEYVLKSGKRLNNSDKYHMYTWVFKDTTHLYVRVYDDGVAFQSIGADPVVTYRIPNGTRRWLQRLKTDYEGFFPLDSVAHDGKYGYPSLFQYNDSIFGLISESGLQYGNSGSFLTCKSNGYTVTYTDSLDGYDIYQGFRETPQYMHPWRVLMLGRLSDIVESNLVSALSLDCQVQDTAWIQPGVSSWIYWAYNHSSKDYRKVREYIDLAADMGWPYTLIDWEWDEMANGGRIGDAMAYAAQKGVKVNLWYNSGTSWIGAGAPGPQDRLRTKEAREQEMTRLEEMGATGIKVDFFKPDDREMIAYYLDILKDAARHHLLVDFHGCTVPRGWSRTWPNLMSMEAVYGAEWYNNNRRMTNAAPAHNATLPFTRNVIGPMDYTPCTFTDSQNPHITTDCHELALPILFESGLQHMADRPSAYLGLPEQVRNLLSGLPAAWDETLLLAGYPGQSVVIARRSGHKWYIAGINGTDEMLTMKPAFERLNMPEFTQWEIFTDNGDVPGQGFNIATITGKPVLVTMQPRGGFVMVNRDSPR